MAHEQHLISLEDFVASLAEGHSDLQVRIRVATHSARSKSGNVNLHAHYLAFRDGKPTVSEFVDVLSRKLVSFCLHRRVIREEQSKWETLSNDKVLESAVRLHQRAQDLFIRACKNTNRNGECGELVIFLLIESVLRAPQVVAKMSLKTNPQMPVHGSDGIHLGIDPNTKHLKLYWGESKVHASVYSAIKSSIASVAEALEQEKMRHELFLVEDYFDLSGFPADFKDAILSFLDPYDENYNRRGDISVILVAFDFDAFARLSDIDAENVEAAFVEELSEALPSYADKLDAALKRHDISKHSIEVFFLPVPSVEELRVLFQNKIGWSR